MTDRPLYGARPRMSDMRRSLALDIELLGARTLPLATRLHFLRQKVRAALLLARGRSGDLQVVSGQTFTVRGLSDLGTLQANIVDVHDELVLTGVLDEAEYVVDVGANIGQWTTAVKLFRPGAKVVSLEPDPDVFTELRDNVGALSDVTCLCVAVGATTGSGLLHRHELSVMSSLHPRGPRFDPVRAVPVQIDTLDAILGDQPVDVLKVDVEGAEFDVLRGAERTLSRARFLVVELSLDRPAAGSALRTLAWVQGVVPGARIVKIGRAMGAEGSMSQDAVIALTDRDS